MSRENVAVGLKKRSGTFIATIMLVMANNQLLFILNNQKHCCRIMRF